MNEVVFSRSEKEKGAKEVDPAIEMTRFVKAEPEDSELLPPPAAAVAGASSSRAQPGLSGEETPKPSTAVKSVSPKNLGFASEGDLRGTLTTELSSIRRGLVGSGRLAWRAAKNQFKPGHKRSASLGTSLPSAAADKEKDVSPDSGPTTTSQVHRRLPGFLQFDVPSGKHAVQLALGLSCACLFFFFRQQLFGTGGVWVAITVTIVVETQLGSSVLKSIQRIMGTIMGGAAGLAIVAMISYTGPDCFFCLYKPPVMLVLIFLSAMVFSYFRSKLTKYSYLFTLANISMVIVIDGETDPTTLPSQTVIGEAYWMRMVAVMIGIGIGFIVTMFIFPNRSSAKLRGKLVEILRVDLVDAFDEVIDTLVEETMIKQAAIKGPLAGMAAMAAAVAGTAVGEGGSGAGVLPSESAPNLMAPTSEPSDDRSGERDPLAKEHSKEQLHLSLVRSAEDLEMKLASINNKISECRDILKVSDGEPILRGWRLQLLPVEDWKEVILKVGSIFNLAVPLIYLLRLDSEDPSVGGYDMLLDFYHEELVDVKIRIGILLNSISEYLAVSWFSSSIWWFELLF